MKIKKQIIQQQQQRQQQQQQMKRSPAVNGRSILHFLIIHIVIVIIHSNMTIGVSALACQRQTGRIFLSPSLRRNNNGNANKISWINKTTVQKGTAKNINYLYGSKMMMSSSESNVIPRAAVSVLVRYNPLNREDGDSSRGVSYALVQRGTEPNKGMWSLPGGKIESGEPTMEAARRELWEETGLSQESLQWCSTGPIMSSDSIIRDAVNDKIRFHYVISQCFAEVKQSSIDVKLIASDDAADAKWWTPSQISQGVKDGKVTPGVEKVITRAESMHLAGLLID